VPRKDLPYYPLFLDIAGKLCLVAGGGRVAERKVRMLLTCGARVRVVSPRPGRGIRALHEAGRIELHQRAYNKTDLRHVSLVFAATDDPAINRQVSVDAEASGVFVNIADSPELCDFIVPAVVRRGPVVIAISTSATLPMLSRKLREEIGGELSKDYARYARKVGALRKLLIERVVDRRERRKILREVAKADISEVAAMSMKELRERFLR